MSTGLPAVPLRGLASFLDAATTALVSVGIEEAVHVGGFQRVTAWRPVS